MTRTQPAKPLAEPVAPAAPKGSGPGSALALLRRFGRLLIESRPVLLVVLIAVLSAYMMYYHQYSFPTTSNLKAVLIDAAQEGILVVGMMLLMIGGSFDLSIGGILALSGITCALGITEWGLSVPIAVLVGLGTGAACGLVNGLIVTRLRINALIVTLAMQGVLYGVTQLLSGTGVDFIDDGFAKIGQSTWLGLQTPFWFMLVVVLLGSFGVGQVRFFRQYYFVGGNARAARLSGIRTQRLMLLAFVIMGLLAGLAGVLASSRLNSAVVSAGMGVELQVITAAVLGGASLKGGEGTVIGGVLGVIFIALVNNALIILQVDAFWQNIVVGLVLLAAVSLDRWKQVTTD